MKIRYFRHGVGDGRELNFIGAKWNVRVSRHQVALWRNYAPVFDVRIK